MRSARRARRTGLPLSAVRVRVEIAGGAVPAAITTSTAAAAAARAAQRLLRDRIATPVGIGLAPLIIPLVLVTAFEFPLTW